MDILHEPLPRCNLTAFYSVLKTADPWLRFVFTSVNLSVILYFCIDNEIYATGKNKLDVRL